MCWPWLPSEARAGETKVKETLELEGVRLSRLSITLTLSAQEIL